MTTSKLIFDFSSHFAAFGFQAATLPDNIVLNAANRKTHKSFFGFSD